jgi:hypothetical protein
MGVIIVPDAGDKRHWGTPLTRPWGHPYPVTIKTPAAPAA